MRRVVRTDNAPLPVGPYSQAVVAGDFVYVAGQGPTDPATGRKVEGGVQAETEQVLKNIQAILEAAGSSLEKAYPPEQRKFVPIDYKKDWAYVREVDAQMKKLLQQKP